jgi:GxxExxY protein
MVETEQINKITEKIIGAAINVHRVLGPGLLESAYEACLAFEVVECGIRRLVNELPETPRALRSLW